MSTTKKPTNSPHAPRPQGRDLAKRVYKVEDKDGKQFGADLTWDEAWKRKEEVAGARKSTTPRIVLMGAGDPNPMNGNGRPKPQPKLPGYSEAQRQAAVTRAAAQSAAAAADMATRVGLDVSPEAIADIGASVAAEMADMEALSTQMAELYPNDPTIRALAEAVVETTLGDDMLDDSALDDLVDEANKVSER